MKPSTTPFSGVEEVTFLTWHALVARADELGSRPPGTRLYVFTLDEFRRQLDHLAAEGFATVSLADFLRWHQGGGPLPPKPIVVSFDDGHRSNAELALPALAERGQRATFFITAGRVGGGCGMRIAECGFQPPIRDPKSEIRNEEQWMTWGQLRALLDAGMEIGSHTLTHPCPSELTPDALRRELAESRRVLADGLGAAVDFVASPTGYDSRHFGRLAREVGYRAALQGVIGRNRRSTDLFALRRVVLKRSMDFGLFCRLVDPAASAHVRLCLAQAARNAVRRLVGGRCYEWIRGRLLSSERHKEPH